MKYAVSSCLMGMNCKYNGKNNKNEEIITFLKDKEFVCVCPEVLGGLSTPRDCCEIQNGRVVTNRGNDVTSAFRLGAQLAYQRFVDEGVEVAILQARSPSCGKGKVYDGTFTKQLTDGNGVFVELLLQHGIKVISCKEINGYSTKNW